MGHTDDAENIMCVIRGYKDFYIVSPFESKFVYSGQKEEYPGNYSPVNFDNPDLTQWPEFSKAHTFKVRIESGDCLYIPSNWWHQVNSSPDRTIAISHWWRSHHPFVNILSAYFNHANK